MSFLWSLVLTILCAQFVLICAQKRDTGPDSFTAAVLEHRHRHDVETDSMEEMKQKNLNYFKKAVEVASEKGTDILVFNEYGTHSYFPNRTILRLLAEHVPNPDERNFNPCKEKGNLAKSLVLVTLSCMAKKHKMFVVANMIDEQPCDSISRTCDLHDMENCDMNDEKCPEDGFFLYNTDVVFDRKGYLISRYRKHHPYIELVNVPSVPDYSFFETEFGVFGLIVCFDCIFKESVNLVEKYGIETLLFPTFWFDDISPLNAVELQQAWALSNGVNFLAANGHRPGLGSLGSGIYSKYHGALKYTYNPDGLSKLLVTKVPRKMNIDVHSEESVTQVIIIAEEGVRDEKETGNDFPEQCYHKVMGNATDDKVDYRCFKQQLSSYSLEKLTSSTGVLKKCHNGMCCSVSYSAESMNEDYYLAVYNGTNDVKDYFFWCEESCFLVRCDPYEDKLCALWPSTSKTVFRSIEMKASLTATKVYPTVLKTKNRLAPKSEWNLETDENISTLKFKSQSPDPILKVGFVGRCYDRDPPFKPWH